MRKTLLPITRDNDLKELYATTVGSQGIRTTIMKVSGHIQFLAKGEVFTTYYNRFRYYYRPQKPVTVAN